MARKFTQIRYSKSIEDSLASGEIFKNLYPMSHIIVRGPVGFPIVINKGYLNV